MNQGLSLREAAWLPFFLRPTGIPPADRRLYLDWLLQPRTVEAPSSTDSLLPLLLQEVRQPFHLHILFLLLADASLFLRQEEVDRMKELKQLDPGIRK